MTAPTNLYALPLLYLRDGLTNSSAFRTAVGAANAAAAEAYVHYFAAPGETTAPFAVVDLGGPFEAQAGGAGGSTEFAVTGELWMTIVLGVTASDSESEQDIKAANTLGGIIADLLTSAGEAGRLEITGVRIDPPRRPDEKLRGSLGDFVQFDVTITYRGSA
jgi:hypothetical protein